MALFSSKSPASVCDFLEMAAYKWPRQSAVTCQGKTFTWRETAQRCRSLARVLAVSGVTQGDRVAFLGYNCHRCFESYYAPAYLGAILVPVSISIQHDRLLLSAVNKILKSELRKPFWEGHKSKLV